MGHCVAVLLVKPPLARILELDFGFGILDLGFWISGFGFWIFDVGFWILERYVAFLFVQILDLGFWSLDLGFWVLDFLDFGSWILEFGTHFWTLHKITILGTPTRVREYICWKCTFCLQNKMVLIEYMFVENQMILNTRLWEQMILWDAFEFEREQQQVHQKLRAKK